MNHPLFIVNAFTDKPFGGNPAAVMPLDFWPPDEQLQALAAQNNLSETAFFVPSGELTYDLRWFTPVVEVPLCGHATLAAAHILRAEGGISSPTVSFKTRHRGVLEAHFRKRHIMLDLPAVKFESHQVEEGIIQALGANITGAVRPVELPWQVLYELEDEGVIASLEPDISKLAKTVRHCVIVTARGTEYDFVSRMFGPHYGVDEDPVTGSAHCLLAPYWSKQLGKTNLTAAQLSARGGELRCEVGLGRVILSGQCVTYAKAEVVVSL